MMDYPQIVEEIRSFLQATDQTLSDRLRELAAAYSEACREVNARLRRCEDFLQRGLRSEAVHLAQAEPDLLDQVAILDFPERCQWEEVLMTYGMPAPPKLLLLTAEALNEAYANLQPLEQLLRKHRLLALARAPVTARLGVMRQIARIDAGNAVWAEDIGTFEKARIQELEGEIAHAQERGDTRTLDALFNEIRTSEWITAPPLHLIQRVENLAKRRQRDEFREALRTLENELHEAVGACDVERVRRLRERWNEEAVRAHLATKDPLWERVAPAFDWLDEQDRRQAEERKYRAGLLKLEQALKDNASLKELNQLYQALLAREDGIPDDLEMRYQARIEKLRSAARQAKWLLITGGAAAAVLIIALIGYGIRESAQDQKFKDTVRALRQLEEDREYAQAKKLLDDFEAREPRLANRVDFAPTKQRVNAEFEREQERLERFRRLLQEAQMASVDESGNAAVEKAKAEARLSSERAEIDRLVKDRDKRAQELRDQNDRKFRTAVDELRDQIEELVKWQTQTPNTPRVLAQLTKLQKTLADLRNTRGITASMRGLLEAPADRLETVRKSCSQSERQTELTNRLQAVLQSTMTGEEYVQALQDFAKEFPLSPRGQAFQKTLAEQPHWQAVLAWSKLVQPWRIEPLEVLLPDAKGRADQVRAFQQAHPRFVDAAAVGDYLRYLEALGQQDESVPDSAAARLRKVFANVRIKDLWVVRDKDKTYYVVRDPKDALADAKREKEDYLLIRYLSDPEAKEKPHKVPLRNGLKTGRAPQSVLADKVHKMPPNFADRTWDQAMFAILQGIQDSHDMDPILQLDLMQQVLELAGKGSYPLALAFQDPLGRIAKVDLKVKEVPWINPISEAATNLRPLARKVLEELPAIAKLQTAAEQQRERLALAVGSSYHEVAGWLAWEKDAGWQCRSERPPAGSGTLAIVVPQQNGSAVWKEIGKVIDGKVRLGAANDPDLREGRVVFVTRNGKQLVVVP